MTDTERTHAFFPSTDVIDTLVFKDVGEALYAENCTTNGIEAAYGTWGNIGVAEFIKSQARFAHAATYKTGEVFDFQLFAVMGEGASQYFPDTTDAPYGVALFTLIVLSGLTLDDKRLSEVHASIDNLVEGDAVSDTAIAIAHFAKHALAEMMGDMEYHEYLAFCPTMGN